MIRRAEDKDIEKIAEIYEAIVAWEEEHGTLTNWRRGLYPTIKVPQEKIPRGEMYVLEDGGEVCGSMVLNREPLPEYAFIDWQYKAEPEEVLVIHTLSIPPQKAGRGYGRQMVDYAKNFGRQHGCKVIRLDTYIKNEPAKALYLKNGFRLAGSYDSLFLGVVKEVLVFMEHRLTGCAD